MARFLDLETWPRRGAFQFFRGYSNPFFNVCTALEVGELHDFVRATPGTSFFLSYLYLSLRAANEIEPFRYRLHEEGVLVHERIHAGSTMLLENDSFSFAYFGFHDTFPPFQGAARAAMDAVRAAGGSFDPQDGRDDLIHYSTLPWIAFSSFSHARQWGRGDSVPKIVFGKAHEEGGRWRLPISIEVHHALMDGLHVGRYLERLQHLLQHPESPEAALAGS